MTLKKLDEMSFEKEEQVTKKTVYSCEALCAMLEAAKAKVAELEALKSEAEAAGMKFE